MLVSQFKYVAGKSGKKKAILCLFDYINKLLQYCDLTTRKVRENVPTAVSPNLSNGRDTHV